MNRTSSSQGKKPRLQRKLVDSAPGAQVRPAPQMPDTGYLAKQNRPCCFPPHSSWPSAARASLRPEACVSQAAIINRNGQGEVMSSSERLILLYIECCRGPVTQQTGPQTVGRALLATSSFTHNTYPPPDAGVWEQCPQGTMLAGRAHQGHPVPQWPASFAMASPPTSTRSCFQNTSKRVHCGYTPPTV